MLNNRRLGPWAVLLLCAFISPMANAKFFWQKEEKRERKTFVFAAYGSYNIDGDDVSGDDRYHEIGLGAKLSKHFGVEGVFTDFGKFSGDIARGELNGFSANLTGYFPVNEYLDMYLKGGIFFSNMDLGDGITERGYKDEQPNFGIGLNISVAEPMTFYTEFSHYRVSIEKDDLVGEFTQTDFEFNTLKIGAKYFF